MMKYNIYITTIILSFVLAFNATAQDENTYMHYIDNPILMNVGATGFNHEHNALVDYRSQWSGFDGAPRNFLGSYHANLNDNMGLGGLISMEQLGITNRLRFKASYAYQLQFESGKIGIGLGAEIQQEKLRSDVGADALVDITDAYLQELQSGANYFDVDFGIYGEFNSGFVFGLAVPDLIRSRIDETQFEDSTSTSFKNYGVFLGYKYYAENIDVTFYPSIYSRKSFTYENNTDINLMVSFLDDQLTTGVSYGINGFKRLGFLLGVKLEKVGINYSYDISRREFQTYSGGGHELSLSLRIPYTSKNKEVIEEKLIIEEIED